MATSSCPKCGKHAFELKTHSPAGSQFKFMFIQCSDCGCVVGTTDYFNVPSLLEKIAAKLGFKLFG